MSCKCKKCGAKMNIPRKWADICSVCCDDEIESEKNKELKNENVEY